MEELVSGLLRPKLFPFGKLSKAQKAAQKHYGYQNKSLILNPLKNQSALGASEFSPSSFEPCAKVLDPKT